MVYVCARTNTFIHSYVRDSRGLGAARQTHLAQRTFVDKRHLTPVFGMKLESDSESEVEPESSPARRHCVRLWWTCWVRRRRDKLPKIKRCCRSKCRWLERERGVWGVVRPLIIMMMMMMRARTHGSVISLHVPAKLAKK